MDKEKITKFDLEDAFKALDEIDYSSNDKVTRESKHLDESFKRTDKFDALLEDYYNVNSNEDLELARDEREDEVAKAKLAKIEKIVDLDAETPEDVQPSYAGKHIVQCPQCMTLFYRNPEDLVKSEDNPDMVNVGEACPNCGNEDGYTVIGKVAEVTPEEAENFEDEEAPAEEAPVEETPVEETPTEEEAPVEEEAPAEEIPEDEELPEAELTESTETTEGTVLTEEAGDDEEMVEGEPEIGKPELEEPADEEVVEEAPTEMSVEEVVETVEEVADEIKEVVEADEDQAEAIDEVVEEKKEELLPEEDKEDEEEPAEEDEEEITEEIRAESLTEQVENALNEATDVKDLNKKLEEHNEYIEALQNEIKKEEEAVKNSQNEFIKKMHENSLETLKAALEKAIPEEVKAEEAVNDLPTPEEAAEEITEEAANLEEEVKVETEKCEDGECCKKTEVFTELPDFNVEVEQKGDDKVEVEVEPKKELNESIASKIDSVVSKWISEGVDEEPIEEKCEYCPKCGQVVCDCKCDKLEEEAIEDITDAEIKELFNDNEAFNEPVSDEEVDAILNDEKDLKECNNSYLEDIDEVDEVSLEECASKALTEIYSNVAGFRMTECKMNEDNALIIEGMINFKSGKNKATQFVFTEGYMTEDKYELTGINEDLDKDGKFLIECGTKDRRLVVESFNYSYHIGENLVEGIATTE